MPVSSCRHPTPPHGPDRCARMMQTTASGYPDGWGNPRTLRPSPEDMVGDSAGICSGVYAGKLLPPPPPPPPPPDDGLDSELGSSALLVLVLPPSSALAAPAS